MSEDRAKRMTKPPPGMLPDGTLNVVVEERQKVLSRARRVLALIEANAKQATPGPWDISHGHVFKGEEKNGKWHAFDIACQPWERSQCVYGVHPNKWNMSDRDMRHIATCDPKTMQQLAADLRELLPELKLEAKP